MKRNIAFVVALSSLVVAGVYEHASRVVVRADSFEVPQPVVRTDTSGVPAAVVPSRAEYTAGVGSGVLTPMTVCDKSAALQMTTATTTQLVALVAGQKVRVCAYQLQGSLNATPTNVTFVYGTGANCGTGTTSITPAWTMPATTTSLPITSGGGGLGEVFSTIAANALCATSSAAGITNIFVTYTQF